MSELDKIIEDTERLIKEESEKQRDKRLKTLSKYRRDTLIVFLEWVDLTCYRNGGKTQLYSTGKRGEKVVDEFLKLLDTEKLTP